MTDSMKRYLELAGGPRGASVRGINDHLEASKAGWIRCIGTSQNCISFRYKLTQAGRDALNATREVSA